MVTALKRYNGGRVLVFGWARSRRCRGDVSRIFDITARDLARIHVSYYNDDAKRTKGMYRQRMRRGQARLLLDSARDLIIHGPAHRGANGAAMPTELELELTQSHMAQKPVLRGEVGCACVAREVSVERGGMGERGCANFLF